MGQVTLLLGIHNHQPVGNFGHVFREAYDRCYGPFLDLVEHQTNLRMTLHYTGPLFDWLDKNEPSFLDRLRKRVEQGQVEMLTGGFYEPILASIPERDGIGQIAMMTQYLKRRLRADANGLWLAERVWEPSLPGLLSACGVAYSLLDDTHFQLVGLKPETLKGYYLTEREGMTLAIFPISKRLRYLIPFQQPEETIDYLERLGEQGPFAITYADDGEKFGLWPGTYRWMNEQRWLERFANLIERNRSWLTTMTFSDYLSKFPASGRIYLPNASYEEMMEWALPAEANLEHEKLMAQLEKAGLKEAAQGFLRGGFWNHFLVKYPEINLMHKKMLYVSEKLSVKDVSGRSKPKWIAEARQELYQAQGNDPYWHGLFGGYYLNYLRHAVHEHLIKAENLMQPHSAASKVRLMKIDLDRDGYQELLAETAWMNLYLKPNEGATAIEIDYRPKALCLTHLPMRRPEAYHQKLKQGPVSDTPETGSISSIHERLAVKPSAAGSKLVYDRNLRWSFRDRLLSADTTLTEFETSRYEEAGNFADQPYETEAAESHAEKAIISFHRTDTVKGLPLTVKKTYTLWASRAELTVNYGFQSVQKPGQMQGLLSSRETQSANYQWGAELNLTLLAGADSKRYYRFPDRVVENIFMNSTGVLEDVTEAHLVDEWQGIEIRLEFKPAATFWRFPIETISQSEEGMESTYQGSCLVVLWPLALPLKEKRGGLVKMKIVER